MAVYAHEFDLRKLKSDVVMWVLSEIKSGSLEPEINDTEPDDTLIDAILELIGDGRLMNEGQARMVLTTICEVDKKGFITEHSRFDEIMEENHKLALVVLNAQRNELYHARENISKLETEIEELEDKLENYGCGCNSDKERREREWYSDDVWW